MATFFNNELLTPAPGDAFSYCETGDPLSGAVVFRSTASPDPLPIAALPEVHQADPQPTYALGLLWDFPFLAKLTYETPIAGMTGAFSLTVPFGIPLTGRDNYGTELWQQGEVLPAQHALAVHALLRPSDVRLGRRLQRHHPLPPHLYRPLLSRPQSGARPGRSSP